MCRTGGSSFYNAIKAIGEITWLLAFKHADTVGGTAVSTSGKMVLTTADSGDAAGVHLGDKLSYDIDQLLFAEFLLEVDAFETGLEVWCGMGTAYDPDPAANMTNLVAMSIDDTNDIYGFSDDGTNDVNKAATGLLAPTAKAARYRFDFRGGIQTISPPGVSLGGKGSVLMSGPSGQNGYIADAKPTVHFDMSNYAAGLQPFVCARRTANGGSRVVTLHEIKVGYDIQV